MTNTNTQENPQAFDFDLIVIGAGSGGVRASRIAATHGVRVAIIESSRLGGTCVIRGCVPKKLLMYGSSFAADAMDAAGFGWQIGQARHDWPHLIAVKNKEIDRLESIYHRMLMEAGVTLIKGEGRMTSPHEVSVAGKTYSAGKILIATGSWPDTPDITGLRAHAISSNEALDLPTRPQKLVIFGAGYIALEFASIFNALGTQVHVIYRADLPLRGFDEDIRRHSVEAFKARGITMHSHKTITSVSSAGAGYLVHLDDKTSLTVDKVMAATGRKPNIAALGLEAIGVKTNAKGAISIDDRSQTSLPSIFAIGDVTDRVTLTPVAIAEGHAFADSVFGNKPRSIDYENIPSAIFSQPPIASVGLSESQAQTRYGEIEIYESRFRAMKHSISGRDEQIYMKLITDKASDRVIGVHMLGADSAEIMQGIAIAVKMGARKSDFDATIGIHPSTAEEFVLMRQKRAS